MVGILDPCVYGWPVEFDSEKTLCLYVRTHSHSLSLCLHSGCEMGIKTQQRVQKFYCSADDRLNRPLRSESDLKEELKLEEKTEDTWVHEE